MFYNLKILWSGRRHHTEDSSPRGGRRAAQSPKTTLWARKRQAPRSWRWCVSMCARLSEEGRQHVGCATHFGGDLVMTTFKQRRMDFAVGQVTTAERAWVLRSNGPRFKSQFCHIMIDDALRQLT